MKKGPPKVGPSQKPIQCWDEHFASNFFQYSVLIIAAGALRKSGKDHIYLPSLCPHSQSLNLLMCTPASHPAQHHPGDVLGNSAAERSWFLILSRQAS